jgi:phosphohistidine swiveling domain-containing protein
VQQGNLTSAAVWAFRLALAGAMITVDNPFRLAAAALILALQIPVQAGIAATVARVRAPQE